MNETLKRMLAQADDCSALEFISDYVFEYTTYDSEWSELFARKTLEVCDAITNGTTLRYITLPENYQWFLTVLNMKFLSGRVDWGTSIRGCWWNEEQSLDGFPEIKTKDDFISLIEDLKSLIS